MKLEGTKELTHYAYHSPLIKRLTEKIRNVNITFPELRGHKPINLTNDSANDVLLELNSNQLSALAQQSIKITGELMNSVEFLESKIQSYTYKSLFWGYFALIADGINILTNLVVIFGVISFTKFFGFLGMAVIITDGKGVYMWDLNIMPDVKVLPDINFDILEEMTAINWILKVVMVVAFAILLILFIVFAWFRTTYVRRSFGKLITPRGLNQPYAIELNIWDKLPLLRKVLVENTFIKIPIENMSFANINHLKIKNALNCWVTYKEKGNIYFQLAQPLNIIGLDAKGNRIREHRQKVKFALKDVVWKDSKPFGLEYANNYDFSFSVILKEPTTQPKRKQPRTNFDAESSASAPLLPTELQTYL